MVVFVVANTYIMQVYQFLFVDVIPAEVMGKFVGCYRAVGALGAFIFHRYMFGAAESQTALIYVASAVLYGVSFFLLIWKVKEGEYDEPPPKDSLARTTKAYFTECFSSSFYLKTYFLAFCFWSAIVPLWTFLVFLEQSPARTWAMRPHWD
jgi:hypothetical protein